MVSCSNRFDFDCDDISPEMNTYNFSEAALDISNVTDTQLDVQIVEGINLVFDYTHKAEDCLKVVDDERGARIQFELDPSLNSISLKDEELQSVNCVYHRTGAWAQVSFMLTEGLLEAEKISDTEWQIKIKADVARFSVGEFSINEIFTLQ